MPKTTAQCLGFWWWICTAETGSKYTVVVALLTARSLTIWAGCHDQQLAAAATHGEVLVRLEEARAFNPLHGALVVLFSVEERRTKHAGFLSTTLKLVPRLCNRFGLPVFWSTNHDDAENSEHDLNNPWLDRERKQRGQTFGACGSGQQ